MEKAGSGGRVRHRAAWLWAITATAWSASAAAQMQMPGSFAVNERGAATYTIPLKLPPGVAGVEPKLALVYNSQRGNGLLGMGWTLSGLSAITRCPQTPAQDPVQVIGAVNFDTADRFCLDAQRLQVVSGTYGAASSEYRTELESFSKVTAVGAAGGSSANGPEQFVVKTRAGLTMTYGGTADSRLEAQGKTAVAVWSLNKVSDIKGNSYTVTYSKDGTNGVSYPTRIDYTSNAAMGLAAANTVYFDYENRPDVVPAYQAGSVSRPTLRMTRLRTAVAAGATAVGEYRIAYQGTAFPERADSFVAGIQQCDGSGNCLPATTLSFSAPDGNFSGADLGTGGATGYWAGIANSAATRQTFHFTGDFDGDGRTDFMYWTVTGWQVLLNTGSGWRGQNWGAGGKTGYWSGYATSSSQQFHFTGDFNGDGKTDFMYWEPAGWRVLLSTGSGWIGQDWGNGGKVGYWTGFVGNSNQSFHYVGDFNGDGKTDFMYWEPTGWRVLLSTGSGWSAQDWGAGGKTGYWAGYGSISNQAFHFTGDFNGDGKTDFMYWEPGNWRVLLSTGSGWVGQDWGAGGKVGYWTGYSLASSQSFHFASDFNGDGKTDFMYWEPGNWRILLSTGSGWVGQDWGAGGKTGYWSGYNKASSQSFHFTGDFNSDGKADFMYWEPTGWRVLLSSGSGWIAQEWGNGGGVGYWTGYTSSANYQSFHFPGDFKGRGKADLMYWAGGTSGWRLLFNDGLRTVSSITEGLGAGTVITTKALPQLAAAYNRSHLPTAPRVVITPPLPVVTESRQKGVAGESRTTRYTYDSAVVEMGTGRGFLGFAQVGAKDQEFGTWTETQYRLDWPFTGLAKARYVSKSHGSSLINLSDSQTEYTCQNPASAPASVAPGAGAAALTPGQPGNCVVTPGARYQVWASRSTERHNDLGALPLPGTRTEVSDVDKFGNVGRVKVDALNGDGSASGHVKQTDTWYFNDETNWILGRPLRSSVKAVTP